MTDLRSLASVMARSRRPGHLATMPFQVAERIEVSCYSVADLGRSVATSFVAVVWAGDDRWEWIDSDHRLMVAV